MQKDKLKKILVIEDVKSLSRALELKLRREGFDVVTVGDGEKGIEAILKDEYSLIVLDLMMPKVDGFKVLEAMGELKKDIPVIVLTNLGQIEDEKRAAELGANEFFVKSEVSVASLVSHIKSLFMVDQTTQELPIAA